jgi:hypothetical protein
MVIAPAEFYLAVLDAAKATPACTIRESNAFGDVAYT